MTGSTVVGTMTVLIDAAALVVAAIGCTMVLACLPWFKRSSMSIRLEPYLPSSTDSRRRRRDAGLHESLEPIVTYLGTQLSRALGMVTELETRLRRAGHAPDVYAFRLRQLLTGLLALSIGSALWVLLGPPPVTAVGLVLGLPLLAVIGYEQLLSSQIARRQTRVAAELPVVIEQMGMLISAGYSLTSAMAHLAERGSGCVADDLRQVGIEVRRGVPPTVALDNWAEISGLDSVRRVVATLALQSEASDLASLITAEARSIRAEAHRDLVEQIERRAQLVWIPVTVATLVPGLIFLAVPFYSAMSKVTGV